MIDLPPLDCRRCDDPIPGTPSYPLDYDGLPDLTRPFHASCLDAAVEGQAIATQSNLTAAFRERYLTSHAEHRRLHS